MWLERGDRRGGGAAASRWRRCPRRSSATSRASADAGRVDAGAPARTCAPGTRRRSRTSSGLRARRSCGSSPRSAHGAAPTAALPAARRAARELLALQSSDWAFMAHARAGGRLSGRARPQPLAARSSEAIAALGRAMTDFRAMNGSAPTLRDARWRSGLDERLRGLRSQASELAPLVAPVLCVARGRRCRLMRVLILSWEYPPLIEGGLARHVRKLAENLVMPGRRGARADPRPRGVACRGDRRGRVPAPGAGAAAPGRADASSSPGSST